MARIREKGPAWWHDERGRLVARAHEKHPHPDQTCAEVSCPNAPTSGKQRSGHARLVTGGSFLFDGSGKSVAVWGDGDEVLCAEDEGTMITGPQGVGKSTGVQQYVLHRIGLRTGRFLGYSVQRAQGKVLYLALDRPAQIRRSILRMVTEDQKEYLEEHLLFWRGPLPFDVIKDSKALADFAEQHGASDVIVDSYKDLNPSLQRPEIAGAINNATQEVIARGIQWFGINHQRKATSENKRPTTLDDVFGGQWLTGGLGSVIVFWGEPGDTDVELIHRKQPEAVVGPFTIRHDHKAGRTVKLESEDERILPSVRQSGAGGISEPELTLHVCGVGASDRELDSSKRRLNRRLKSFQDDGLVKLLPGHKGGSGGSTANRWFATEYWTE